MHGIAKIERNYRSGHLTNPMKSLRANPLTIKQYINAIQLGIPINPTIRKCWPTISYAKVCLKCKYLKCQCTKDGAPFCCINCGSSEHTADKCKESTRCVNCKRSHRSDSEECVLLRKKTQSQNDYVLSILLGEEIIINSNAILRDPELANKSENGCSRDEIKEIVTEMMTKNETIISMNERLAKQEAETQIIKNELINLAAADAKIIEQVNAVENKLDNATNTIQSTLCAIYTIQKQQQIILLNNYKTNESSNQNPLIYITKTNNQIKTNKEMRMKNKYFLKQRLDEIEIEKNKNTTDNINNMFGRISKSGEIKLKICSFNCHGANANKMCLNNLINTHDICAIQETMHGQTKTNHYSLVPFKCDYDIKV